MGMLLELVAVIEKDEAVETEISKVVTDIPESCVVGIILTLRFANN